MTDEISVITAAREADCHPAYLYGELALGRLLGTKRDGRWFIRRCDFEAWRSSRKRAKVPAGNRLDAATA